jgi:hypothetical protein
MRSFWRTRSLRWKDITGIRLYKRDGGAIELTDGTRKLTIDSRFSAAESLLAEIQGKAELKIL